MPDPDTSSGYSFLTIPSGSFDCLHFHREILCHTADHIHSAVNAAQEDQRSGIAEVPIKDAEAAPGGVQAQVPHIRVKGIRHSLPRLPEYLILRLIQT